MAKFIGTEQEFLDLFGSTLLTNAVKSYTPKSVKGKTCQFCKKIKELQAAHCHGTPGRLDIARSILNTFPKLDGSLNLEVDMHEFLKKFYHAHIPLKDHFIFLCEECHKEYDKDEVKKRRPKGSNLFCGYGKPPKVPKYSRKK